MRVQGNSHTRIVFLRRQTRQTAQTIYTHTDLLIIKLDEVKLLRVLLFKNSINSFIQLHYNQSVWTNEA